MTFLRLLLIIPKDCPLKGLFFNLRDYSELDCLELADIIKGYQVLHPVMDKF
jgi:hypothetical protein